MTEQHKKMSKKQIKNFWKQKATSEVDKFIVTHGDIYQKLLEINRIKTYLKKSDIVLDVGCGNGYSTAKFAAHCKKIIGLDYSVEMINRAKRENSNKSNISFVVGDVLNSNFPENYFDVVISERCLINISTWEKQKGAISNITNIIKSQGIFLMMEGCAEGRANLNKLRVEINLPAMPEVAHNTDLSEPELLDFLKKDFEILKIEKFGLYELVTRLIYPLFIFPEQPKYGSKFNKIAYELSLRLSCLDDLSRLIFLVLRKR